MPLVLTHADDSPLTGLTLTAERGIPSSPIDLKILNTGAEDVAGAFLTLYAEKDPGGSPGQYFSTGHPSVDERMGRFQITGQDSSATPGQEIVLGVVQPLGHLAVARLPVIKPGDWILANFWIEQGGASAGGGSVNIKLEVANDVAAEPIPPGVSMVGTGIDSGRKQPRSYFITGRAPTASGPPDDHVAVDLGGWLIQGEEYQSAGVFVTLDQNDGAAAALASGEEYIAVLTQSRSGVNTTKGTKDLAGSAVRPTPPSGELLIAWVTVAYGGSGSVIGSGDIEDARVFGRYKVAAPPTGLSVTVHPGEGIIDSFRQIRSLKADVTLTAASTNRVWLEWNGSITVTLDDVPPSAGAVKLAVVLTDGSNCTSNTDTRAYIIPGTSQGDGLALADGNNDDVALASPASVVVAKITGVTTTASLRGLQAPFFAQIVGLVLATGGNDVTIKHEDSGSSPANRFTLPGGTDVVLADDDAQATVVYDTASSRWRLLAKNF